MNEHIAPLESAYIEFVVPGDVRRERLDSSTSASARCTPQRAVILIQKALPAGSYQVLNLTGGNSVNSIASDGLIEMKLNAPRAAEYQKLVEAVTKAAAEGAAAENAFRGVKPGDLTSGAPATVRSSVKTF